MVLEIKAGSMCQTGSLHGAIHDKLITIMKCLTAILALLLSSTTYCADITLEVLAISENRQLLQQGGKWVAPTVRMGKEIPGLIKVLTLGLVNDTEAAQVLNLTLRATHAQDWEKICSYGRVDLKVIRDDQGNTLKLTNLPGNGAMLPFDNKMLVHKHGVRYLDIPLYFQSSSRKARRLSELKGNILFEECVRETVRLPLIAGNQNMQHEILKRNGIVVHYSAPGRGPYKFPDMPRVQVTVSGNVGKFGTVRLLEANGKPLYIRDDPGPQHDTAGKNIIQSLTLWDPPPKGVIIEVVLETTRVARKVALAFHDIPLP